MNDLFSPFTVVIKCLSVPSNSASGNGKSSQTSRKLISVELNTLHLLSSFEKRFHHVDTDTLHHTRTVRQGERNIVI